MENNNSKELIKDDLSNINPLSLYREETGSGNWVFDGKNHFDNNGKDWEMAFILTGETRSGKLFVEKQTNFVDTNTNELLWNIIGQNGVEVVNDSLLEKINNISPTIAATIDKIYDKAENQYKNILHKELLLLRLDYKTAV